uniref:Uncharacterized protein n=1 Tax=Timspurckia oligopyrenoides TaxID=708627 RepID=A0A7S0ZFA0_9RHOD|mmetsp:Transcript_3009/g.5317  ORF Transcript_3009/g.5317 Transcript_3009/m.5317 type:complete len:142 (+) Transcript_3009:51-476(+)
MISIGNVLMRPPLLFLIGGLTVLAVLHAFIASIPSRYLTVLISVPDSTIAANISSSLVSNRLASRVLTLDNIHTTYRDNLNVLDSQQVLVIATSHVSLFSELKSLIKQLHPDSISEIIGIPITYALPETLELIRTNTKPPY